MANAKSTTNSGRRDPSSSPRNSGVPGVLVYRAMYKFLGDDGVHGEVLDFPGAITCAPTLDEARRLLGVALTDMVESHIIDGQPIPQPDPTQTSPEADLEEPIYLVLRGASDVTVTPGRS